MEHRGATVLRLFIAVGIGLPTLAVAQARLAWGALPARGGLLGLTREEVAQRLGEGEPVHPVRLGPKPEESPPLSLKFRDPLAPAVTALKYKWKRGLSLGVFLIVGYNEAGRSVYVRALGWPDHVKRLLTPFLETVSSGWQAETRLIDGFPPLSTEYAWIDSAIVYRNSGTGVAFGRQVTRQTDVKIGLVRKLLKDRAGSAWAVYDVRYDAKFVRGGIIHREALVADTSTFWSWVFDELMGQCRSGMRYNKELITNKDSRNILKDGSYEEVLAWMAKDSTSLSGLSPMRQLVVTRKRMVLAVMAAVQNPTVPVELIVEPARFTWGIEGSRITEGLVDQLRSMAEPRSRAAKILGELNDPTAVPALIESLATQPRDSQIEALQKITSQDLGEDLSAWRTWWNANSADVLGAFEQRMMRLHGDVEVYVGHKTTVYHRPYCPMLKLDTFLASAMAAMKVKEARGKYTPCSGCKPAK